MTLAASRARLTLLTERLRHVPALAPVRRLAVVVAPEVAALDFDEPRPRTLPLTRGECADGPRPCPLVTCRHHLYVLHLSHTALHVQYPNLPVEEALEAMPETCSLDFADAVGGASLEDVGEAMGISRQRVQQIEAEGLAAVVGEARKEGLGPT